MENSLGSRIKHAWNAFMNKDPTYYSQSIGASSSLRPDRPRLSKGNERSIVTAIYNRMAVDTAAIPIRHCRVDENGRYTDEIDSELNKCLSLQANIDQTGRAFIHDVVLSMLDEGCVAIVPVDTKTNPKISEAFEICSLRTGKIIEWYPKHVKVRVYNERIAEKQDIILDKKMVAILENPFYAVMNEPNSTLKRLIRKLNILDAIDEQSGSGKLDLIIQLPYTIKSQARRDQANERRADVERQLTGSKYGIAYVDATERITQLNRSVDNNLMHQIEYLTSMLYSQLGISQAIMDGTADEKEMLNYTNRTLERILATIVDGMRCKFLTKTARTRGQDIMYFNDPFKLVPVESIATIADTFTRNEIMTSNEIRQIIGLKPSNDPKADQLVNSNISQPNQGPAEGPIDESMAEPVDQSTSGMSSRDILAQLGGL